MPGEYTDGTGKKGEGKSGEEPTVSQNLPQKGGGKTARITGPNNPLKGEKSKK